MTDLVNIFNDLYDATQHLELEAEMAYHSNSYFKGELLRLADGRWRVGIILEPQLELPFDGMKE